MSERLTEVSTPANTNGRAESALHRALNRIAAAHSEMLDERAERRKKHAVRWAESGQQNEHFAFWEMSGAVNALIDVADDNDHAHLTSLGATQHERDCAPIRDRRRDNRS